MNDGKDTAAEAAATAGAAGESGAHESIGNSIACPSASAAEEVNPNYYAIDFRVHKSMRYHQARRAWWTSLNRLSSIAAALAGSAAVITVSGKNGSPYWAYVAAGSGAFAALNAALGFTERAREHAALYDKFSSVAAKMALEATPDDAVARRYESEVLTLEASEPPSIHTLNVICHNLECEARGHKPEEQARIFLINRIFKSVGTVIDYFPPKKAPNYVGALFNFSLLVLVVFSAVLWYQGPEQIYDAIAKGLTSNSSMPPVVITASDPSLVN